MKKFKSFSTILFFAIILFSCKEDPLSPNEDAAEYQQAGIDYLNNGGSVNGGGGAGGGNGGGSGGGTIVEYFTAEVDGVLKTGSNPFYQEALGIKQINSSTNSATDLFQINIFGDLEAKTYDFPYISYFQSTTSIYEAFNGKLIIESVTADQIKGTFYFDAEKTSSPDTISVTNGRFLVER